MILTSTSTSTPTSAPAKAAGCAGVKVGDTAPPVEFGPLTTRMFVRYAGASGDFNPMHYDDRLARSAGFPSVFSQGMHSAALLAGYAVSWLDARNIRRVQVRFREQVWPDDTLTCSGTVTEVNRTSEGTLVTVDLTATRQTGGVAISASADFLLVA
jgi:acyl dehydratase